MAYFDIFKYISNLISRIVRYFVKSTLRVFTIIIVILLTMFLFFNNYSKAFNEQLNPYDRLLNDTIINKMYEEYKEIWDYSGIIFFKQPTQYIIVLFDNTCFKQYISNNEIYMKNLSQINTIIDVYTADLQGNNRGRYSSQREYPNSIVDLGSLSEFSFSDTPIYESLDSDVIWYPEGYYTMPSILNSSNDISTWNFNTLYIDGGSVSPTFNLSDNVVKLYYFELFYKYEGQSYSLPVNQFVTTYNNNTAFTISIPKNRLYRYINLYNGNTLEYYLVLTAYDSDNKPISANTYELDSYTLSLTTEQQNKINADSSKYVEGDTNEQTRIIQQSMGNDDVDSDFSNDLLGFSTDLNITDNTGIGSLFVTIYNAFCTNNIQDISLKIPFTNNYIHINEQNIVDFYPSIIVNLMSIVYFGLFSIWVLKDIRKMINDIYEGKFWNLASQKNGDIQKELL